MGKTITITSSADGSLLASDAQSDVLVNVPGDSDAAKTTHVRFEVVDLGKGRVALKVASGRFVSGAENGATLKNLAGRKPGDAEAFQWVNLMRGDTMFMSLTNHRYLTTKPNHPGLVTVTASGPTPARKSGECFK
jgi:hypothetical protein